MNAYLSAMRKYAVFQGRATRPEFWLFMLVFLLISIVAALIDAAVGTQFERSGLFLGLVQLVHVLPALGVSVRRLHDLDRTGWWLLIALTGIGEIVLVVFYCSPGTPGPNRFGPAPLDAAQGSASATSQATVPPRWDPIAEIERLSDLRARGSLSDTEFEVMKAQALSRPRGA